MRKLKITGEKDTFTLILWLSLESEFPKAMVSNDNTGRVRVVPYGCVKFIEEKSAFEPETAERAPEAGEKLMTVKEWAESWTDKSRESLRVSQLRESNRQLREEVDHLKNECNTLNREANRLRVAIVDIIAEKDGEIAKLKAALASANNARDALNANIARQKDRIESEDKQIEALESIVKRWMAYAWGKGDTAEHSRAGRLYDDSHRAIYCEDDTRWTDAREDEITRLNAEIEHVSNARAELGGEVARLKDTIDNLVNSNDKTLEAMQYEIAEADKQIEALESLLMRWVSWAWAIKLRGPHDEIYSQLQRDTHAILRDTDAT